jgi:hypothetical protein
MLKLKKLEELLEHVKLKGDVLTCTAGELRVAYGAERLGVNVRHAISSALKSHGLDHYPSMLPDRQDEPVRVYRQGSPVAELIEAVLVLDDPKADAKLRKAAKNDCEKVLKKIRELVDEEA